MTAPNSRRNFLQGRFSSRKGPLRPPWALAEGDFLSACTRCGDCTHACPTQIINARDAGYPGIDFSEGECTFCGDCVAACKSGALLRRDNSPPWSAQAAIGEDCLALQKVECRVCGDLCDLRAIRFLPQIGGVASPSVDTTNCTGCGACIAACPTRAITVA